MNSLMSILMSASSLPNMNSASALASSVFPTPVGPRKMNEPIGPLRILEAGARATDGLRDDPDRLFLADDPAVEGLLHLEQPLATPPGAIRVTGMPVHIATTWAISSSSTVGWSPETCDCHSARWASTDLARGRLGLAQASRPPRTPGC